MTRAEKAAAVDALEKRIDEVTAVYLADYSGLTVEESTDLRRQFDAAGVSFLVAKTQLTHLSHPFRRRRMQLRKSLLR